MYLCYLAASFINEVNRMCLPNEMTSHSNPSSSIRRLFYLDMRCVEIKMIFFNIGFTNTTQH